MRMRILPPPIVLAAACWLPTAAGFCQEEPGVSMSFAYGFSGCDGITGAAGSEYDKAVDCVLSTSDNSSAIGVESWSFCVQASNATIRSITIEGTDAEGLMDKGWEINEIVNGGAGAISAALLSFRSTVTLPPEGDVSVAAITLQGIIPAGEAEIVDLSYLDGLSGSGLPVDSIVTYDGETLLPELGGCAFPVTPDRTPPAAPTGLEATPGDRTVNLSWRANTEDDLAGYNLYRDGELLAPGLAESSYNDNTVVNDITYTYAVTALDHSGNESAPSPALEATPEVPPAGPFVRGDANADLRVNIADGIWVLGFLFTGGPMPPCNAAANSNGDDRVNVADPVYSLNWLFRGGPGPPPPSSCALSSNPGDIIIGCDQPAC